ncbi:protein translocase subunit SecF [Catellatospora citrea]|uniref:Protein-export membrane protein SecF n=1 Tax=Catellatospora citrea TaxID=53366 RepID=A0A8J3P376_9ACTN|nr:protein translocase subunit SecF [Catellatospora citrea]RKE11750.1 protein translocase subunit secF [Catellatospora citrea]GIF99800.1 protein-export membrane protein SecF [Catellatospora citrea]
MSGLASRLYSGDAGFQIVGKRKLWFGVAGGMLLIAILAMSIIGFKPGIEFEGGNEFTVPVSAGSSVEVEKAIDDAIKSVDAEASLVPVQKVGDAAYTVRSSSLTNEQTEAVKEKIVTTLKLNVDDVSGNRVSQAWGAQVTEQALIGLALFVLVVSIYLVIRFEWQMAAAAVASLVFDLVATAAVYSLVGFEVTPSTVIGFLTILGFALYDVVVVFDKVQENTRGITGSSTQTYAEAANLALNQTFMRSINTALVALLPVGGLLFIGAGLLGAGTLKDLGLVLFIGMGTAVYSSLFFATPVLVWLKEKDPKIANHTARVLARRAAPAKSPAGDLPAQVGAGAGSAAPKAGAKPTVGAKAGRPAGRPAGKRR